MKPPSPLLGFNNNVRHKGRLFHIQTEDSGIRHPHIITHLFADGGRILKTTKTSYAEHVGTPAMGETVRELMKEQHKAMFIALRDGQFDYLFDETAPRPASASVPEMPAPASKAGVEPRKAAVDPPKAAIEPPKAAVEPPKAAVELPKAAIEPPKAGVEPRKAAVEPPKAGVEPRKAAVEPPKAAVGPLRKPTVEPSKAGVEPPLARPNSAGSRSAVQGSSVKVRPSTGTAAPPVAPFSSRPSGASSTRPASPPVSDPANTKAPIEPTSPSKRTTSRPRLDLDPAALQALSPRQGPTSAPAVSRPAAPLPSSVRTPRPATPAVRAQEVRTQEAQPTIDLDLDALERAAAEAQTPFLQQIQDLPPPPASVIGRRTEAAAGSSSALHATESPVVAPAPLPTEQLSGGIGRYAPSRPSSIFATNRPAEGASIFGDDLISEKSLDEVILSYLAEDLDGPQEKK